jgi:RNA polymerase sigma factor (sigma-70 family)
MRGEGTTSSDHELLANLDWVRRLALALTRDSEAAADLTQDVARVWLEKRPRLTAGPQAWLAGVLRRLALDRRRSESARRVRERSAARPERSEELDVVERGARQQRIAQAVLELEEPTRSTILHRYLDGLDTGEVARRMGVTEATVRKRLERGRARLRERLDREFGVPAGVWAFATFEPGLEVTGATMGTKAATVVGAALVIAIAVWKGRGVLERGEPEAIGGTAVVVPAERAQGRAREAGLVSSEEAGGRTEAPAVSATPVVPRLVGHVLVDGVRRIPEGLSIEAEVAGRAPSAKADVTAEGWSLELPASPVNRLWITSQATVPAQIEIPREVASSGGILDLHLTEGRTLELLLLDADTREPLAHLDFELWSQIETRRSLGQVHTRGHPRTHRTDGEGRAVLRGLALHGHASVVVATERHRRPLLMQDGSTFAAERGGDAVWSEWFKDDTPLHVERTILARRSLGEARVTGVVPAWAGALEEVRVVAREHSGETDRGGDAFLLPTDEAGSFELLASAPARFEVWLEAAKGRKRLSQEAEVVLARPGPQGTVSFAPLEARLLLLRLDHVPARGTLELKTTSRDGMRGQSLTCAGMPITHELELLPGDTHLTVSLRLASGVDETGWRRVFSLADIEALDVDLECRERRLRLELPEPLEGEAMVALMRCEGGTVDPHQGALFHLEAGDAEGALLLPEGRWLYRVLAGVESGIWGVVDVGREEEVALRPMLRHAAPGELGVGVRIDEIEGVSIESQPALSRELRPRTPDASVLVPVRARWTPLEE